MARRLVSLGQRLGVKYKKPGNVAGVRWSRALKVTQKPKGNHQSLLRRG